MTLQFSHSASSKLNSTLKFPIPSFLLSPMQNLTTIINDISLKWFLMGGHCRSWCYGELQGPTLSSLQHKCNFSCCQCCSFLTQYKKCINKLIKVLRKIIYSNFKIKALTNNQARNSQVCNTKMTGFGHEHLLFERQMH